MSITEWINGAELVRLLNVPVDTVKEWSRRQSWRTRAVEGSSDGEVQIHLSSLPNDLQTRLSFAQWDQKYARPLEGLTPEQMEAWERAAPDQRARALAKVTVLRHWQHKVFTTRCGNKRKASQEFLREFFKSPQGQWALEALGPRKGVSTLYSWQLFFAVAGITGFLNRRGRRPGKGNAARPSRHKRRNQPNPGRLAAGNVKREENE